jgi:hypothetical protein
LLKPCYGQKQNIKTQLLTGLMEMAGRKKYSVLKRRLPLSIEIAFLCRKPLRRLND